MPSKVTASKRIASPEKIDRAAVNRVNARARWAGEQANEQDILKFFQECDVDEGLSILAKMRDNAQLGAKTLNGRVDGERHNADEGAVCCVCKQPKMANKQWRSDRPIKDPLTGVINHQFICSDSCFANFHRQADVNVHGKTGPRRGTAI